MTRSPTFDRRRPGSLRDLRPGTLSVAGGIAALLCLCAGCAAPPLATPRAAIELQELWAPEQGETGEVPRDAAPPSGEAKGAPRRLVSADVGVSAQGEKLPPARAEPAPDGTASGPAENSSQVDLRVPAMGELTADIALPPDAITPDEGGPYAFVEPREIRFGPGGPNRVPAAADAQRGLFCHRPLYFEQYQLEREGRSLGLLQPAASAAHFFGSVVALPYKMTVEPPGRCSYLAGIGPYGEPVARRPGRVRPRVDGVLVEAGVITGLVFLLP